MPGVRDRHPPAKVSRAREFGVDAAETGAPRVVKAFSRGFGVDAVLITAATTSNQPIEFAAGGRAGAESCSSASPG